MIEILAVRVMGWQKAILADWWITLYGQGEGPATVSCADWNPFTDLNTIHELEKLLTDEQRDAYIKELTKPSDGAGNTHWRTVWEVRHADPAVCADAIARVVAPEEFA
jgi:hypothetical protein